jgi:hypothetical protein
MIAVITGDIINSREAKAQEWLPILKSVLNQYGKEPKQWEIFRGDSFQLEVRPVEAVKAALHIKASIKQLSNLDAQIAVGLGEKEYQAKKITESNGSAFINSGECFEEQKKQTLAVRSPNPQLNEQINLLLALALLTVNKWSKTTALVVKTALENPTKNQVELAEILDKKAQSSISEALTRGGFDEIMRLEKRYRKLIKSL